MIKYKEIPNKNNVMGEMKTIWKELGELTAFSGNIINEDLSFALELNNLPGQKISAFKIEKRNFEEGE